MSRSDDDLVARGGGAFLAEVAARRCLCRSSGGAVNGVHGANHVGTERIVCEPEHKNPPQSISDNEDGNAACVAIPLIVVSLTAECAG